MSRFQVSFSRVRSRFVLSEPVRNASLSRLIGAAYCFQIVRVGAGSERQVRLLHIVVPEARSRVIVIAGPSAEFASNCRRIASRSRRSSGARRLKNRATSATCE